MAKIKEKKGKALVKCFECKHSRCVQWGSNPVIAICKQRRSFGEPYRMVAKSEHSCELYERFNGMIKPIEAIIDGR